MAQMVERGVGKLWDLGPIPRSPILSILFCLISSYAARYLMITICLKSQPATRSITSLQGPRSDELSAHWSTPMRTPRESQLRP